MMRYDSDPQVVKRIFVEAEALQAVVNRPGSSGTMALSFFDELEPLITPLLATLDHFAKLHVLNPQFSLSRFSASYVERELLALQTSISQVFTNRPFTSVSEQVEWHRQRFLSSAGRRDNEHLAIMLLHKIAQLLDTYYVERIRRMHFAAVLNEFVGWSEHIETHGHHDVHAVILFAEKIARDQAVLDHRAEVVREICLLVQERVFLTTPAEEAEMLLPTTALEFSQVYSPYLLELYETLLEDMEIVAIAQQDYAAFERYCQQQEIEVYEEYHDALKTHLKESIALIAADISSTLQTIQAANLLVQADQIYRRYADVETPAEILGQNLSHDIGLLKRTIQHFKGALPARAQEYATVLQKVKKLRGDIMKPAIEVYGEYLNNPTEFFQQLPQRQAVWIPILESALACLEQEDELYQKCAHLKTQIDRLMAT
ncbi:hypothetical protein U27_04446 [Candidatus Vecturithrix granuli]|uniref:Uncharacterized protein n=1 Tax=Vecturithrix granuli TaxID=1499967 RepID=A0A081BYS4_VECG1|nr:hypothetical protein U27_04446 [Candidatus Vecturithrix granuli]